MQMRSLKTRDRILKNSRELFLLHGYETTGVAAICKKAQVSKGAFYHHFPSKHDVLLILIENWLRGVENRIEIIKKGTAPIPQQFTSMIPELSTIFDEADQIPMFLEFWIQSMRDPSIARRMIKPYFKFVSLFEKMFSQGVKEGSFPEGTDPRISSRLLIAFSLGMIMQCMIEPNGEDWQKVSQFSLDKFLTGLQKEQQ